jgi:hypothetical protein
MLANVVVIVRWRVKNPRPLRLSKQILIASDQRVRLSFLQSQGDEPTVAVAFKPRTIVELMPSSRSDEPKWMPVHPSLRDTIVGYVHPWDESHGYLHSLALRGNFVSCKKVRYAPMITH